MARESCNLDKDEAEIFKPSSPSPPSPSSSSQSPQPSSPHLKSCEESAALRSERPEPPSPEIRNFVAPPPPPPPPSSSSTPKPEEGASEPGEESRSPVRFSNRCSTCRRKVGLTGFRCRCGDLFCGRHRYSDVHDCSFDYKAAGREEIAKANPVIKAAKIIKI